MKKLSLTSLLLMTIVVFTSCSVETDPVLEEQTSLSSRDIFEKPPTVQRNPDGSYYLGYELKDGVAADIITDDATNTKSINAYSSDNQMQKKFNEGLSLNGKDSFTVGVNTETDKGSTITILDDDIKFSRNPKKDHLKEYGIDENGDGTYTLNFTVKNNIKVDFIQNQDTGVYEIHLDRGDSSEKDFSRTFTKEEDEDLKISFVNYYYSNTGRALDSVEKSEKPKIIVGN